MNMPDVLTRKVGPLPVGVWVVALAGGIGVAVVIRRRAADSTAIDPAAAPGDTADMTADPATGGAAGGIPWASGVTDTNPGAGNLGPGPIADGPITTNAQWRHRVATVLTREGYHGALVENALARWFNGKTLTAPQRNVIDEAIARVGPPPHPPKHKPEPKQPKHPKPIPRPLPGRDTGRGLTPVRRTFA